MQGPILDFFSKFQGYNKFKENQYKKLIIEARHLGSLTSSLASAVNLPSVCVKAIKPLHDAAKNFLSQLHKYVHRLDADAQRHRSVYRTPEYCPRSAETDCSMEHVPIASQIDSVYADLNECVSSLTDYIIVDAGEFAPDDPIACRKYISNLALKKPLLKDTSIPFALMMWRMAYGNALGALCL